MSSSEPNYSDDHDVDDHDVDEYDVDDDDSGDHNADHVIDEEDYDDESDDTVPTTEEALATTAATAAPGGGNTVPLRPFAGLRVDLRDPDQVWSSARVEEVFPEDDDGRARARLRYDGWGAVWDETLPWPCDRVAPLRAYTRRVRCGVSIGGRARRAWPCRAQIRMPRPGDARAAALLAAEPRVFVQPYGADLLPRAAAGLVGGDDGVEGGCWVKVSRLRRWRCGGAGVHKIETTPTEDATERAWALGERDADCVGVLPPKPFTEGSLLRAVYRVAREIDLNNDDDERCYTGALDLVTATLTSTSTSGDNEDDESEDKDDEADVVPDRVGSAAEDVARTARDDDAANDARRQRPKGDPLVYQPPPELSSTAVRVIEEPVHPDVVRLRKTKRWTARVRRNGAEILLGSFSTQSRALRARETTPSDDVYREGSVVSVSQDVAGEVAKNVVAARREDARLVPLATLVSAWEKSNDDAAVAATATAVGGGGSSNHRRGSVNSGGGSSSNSLNSNKKSSGGGGGNNGLNGSKKSGGGKTKKDNFSAHDWAMQRIRYEEYLKELERRKRLLREETKDQNDGDAEGRARKRARVVAVPTSSGPSAEPSAKTSRSSRKRYVPRKVDLVRHVYVS